MQRKKFFLITLAILPLTSPTTSAEIAKAFEDHDMKVVAPPLKAEYEI